MYLSGALNYECFSEEHKKFTFLFSLPVLIIWVIGVPLFMYLKVTKLVKSGKLTWYTHRIKFGFLIGEYNKKVYFWEFIRMYNKIVIVLISSLLDYNITLKFTFFSLIILAYLSFAHKI